FPGIRDQPELSLNAPLDDPERTEIASPGDPPGLPFRPAPLVRTGAPSSSGIPRTVGVPEPGRTGSARRENAHARKPSAREDHGRDGGDAADDGGAESAEGTVLAEADATAA